MAFLRDDLFARTGVPHSRQKLICAKAWKGILSDATDLSSLPLANGLKVNLMGTSETVALPTAPVTFLEDMTESQVAEVGVAAPAGLQNLGNTCYANALLQCLRRIPEFAPQLKALLSSMSTSSPTVSFLRSLDEALDAMEHSTTVYSPSHFIGCLRLSFPSFADATQGLFKQQDAVELYDAILNTASSVGSSSESVQNAVQKLFQIQYDLQLTNQEAVEPVSVSTEVQNRLTCMIQGGLNSLDKIDHLHQGVSLSLSGEVDKFSEILGRNSVWKKTQRISQLPQYLCVHFLRFFWKPTPESRDHTGLNCKILRPITFPESFDIYEFCNDRLQGLLKLERDYKESQGLHGSGTVPPPPAHDPVGPGVPSSFDGRYELFAVLSHKGRSSDSGHYMGWTRYEKSGGSHWFCFDDDDVQECNLEHVLNLKGGGDNDMVYMAFYRAI